MLFLTPWAIQTKGGYILAISNNACLLPQITQKPFCSPFTHVFGMPLIPAAELHQLALLYHQQ
jgi:hypothetical protein